MQWDVFCRVVDHFGDIGVCWRLAADLASRGERVSLWVDDRSALAWMAPGGAVGVTVRDWGAEAGRARPGDVVVEAFGCNPPAAFVQQMAKKPSAPIWINLEYLSAEAAVERNHTLPSPQLDGPGTGLVKWFFYPGFTEATGGLIRETGLQDRQRTFDAPAWLRAQGLGRGQDERLVSLFCYANPSLPALLARLADAPTLLLATAGIAADQVRRALGPALTRESLRAAVLPALTQPDYDALLWASDLNFVRGEDSFVRAQWAGKPFVWQVYPQHDRAHEVKLDAFLQRHLASAEPRLAAEVRALWCAWNGAGDRPLDLAPLPAWRQHCAAWRAGLLAQDDLTRQLLRFVAERR